MKEKLLITFEHTAQTEKFLDEHFEVSRIYQSDQWLKHLQNENIRYMLVTFTQKFSADFISQLPQNFKAIGTSSVGFNHIDLKACALRGISVTNTPGILSAETADLAMTLLLNVSRRMNDYREVMSDGWGQHLGQNEMLGVTLMGKTLGLFGMGRIGFEFAKRAQAFGLNIQYCNRSESELGKQIGAKFVGFEELLRTSDIVSLHAPLTDSTAGIMDSKAFGLMKKGAIFINTARGELVDEEALMKALERKHLFGAGLDVFCHEPDFDERFLRYPNVVLTPHVGSATIETRTKMGLLVANDLLKIVNNESPLHKVSL